MDITFCKNDKWISLLGKNDKWISLAPAAEAYATLGSSAILTKKNDPAGNIMNASPVAWLHNSGRQRKGKSCGTLTKLGQSG